ncbi:MAG: LmeA family phospholipid-binding protein [Myxococcota bacterium]
MKKLVIVLGVLGVLAVVFVGGALYADSRAHSIAEQEAAKRVQAVLPGAQGVEVVIDSWPILLAVATGTIEHLTVTAHEVSRGGVVAEDLTLSVHEIELDTEALWSDKQLIITGIHHAALTGTMSQEAVSLAARAPIEFKGGLVVVVTPKGQTFVATLRVEDRKIRLIPPLPGYDAVEFPLPPEDIVPCTPEVEVLEGKLALTCEVSELPAAVKRAMGH